MNIIELELLTDNIAATEKFYGSVLGLKPMMTASDELLFSVGASKLIFRQSVNVKPVYHFAIDVPNNRFEEAHATIKAKAPLLPVEHGNDIADFINWDAKSFYFYDNNGNILEIITRYANKTFSEERLTVASYISISEIGLVTSNVPELADRIKAEFDIPIYHRQPSGQKFTVCGDDEGLFILAEKGRHWYPTNVKSHAYPTRIIAFDKGVVHHIAR